jgi:SAM-dependent methyltransferase
MESENEEPKEYFDRLGRCYERVWGSLAKKAISDFELNLVERVLAERSVLGMPAKVLEIGVGTGRVAEKILRFPVDYYGVDVAAKMLAVFRGRFGDNPKVKGLVVGNVGNVLPFAGVNFDVIVAWRVLYYLENWPEVIKRLAARLNPGGILVFSLLNRHSTAILGKFCGGPLRGYNTTYAELRGILRKNHFREVKITGYARLPDVIYDGADHPLLAQAVFFVENVLQFFLGETLWARMFYVVARR